MTQPNPPTSSPPGKETSSTKGKKLLDQYRDIINLKHYSPRTGDTYIIWAKEYILFHHKRHPKEMGAPEINQFLIHLASEKKISVSTQNQALSAILFLYRHVLHIELDEASLAEFRPQRAKNVPTVLSKDEVKRVSENMTGIYKLIAQVMYGGGLRVMETMRLRVKACPEPVEGILTLTTIKLLCAMEKAKMIASPPWRMRSFNLFNSTSNSSN